MFEKHLEESSTPTLQESTFYVDLLVAQNETKKALEYLESESAKNSYKIERQRTQKIAELRASIGEHDKALEIYLNLFATEYDIVTLSDYVFYFL